MPTQLDLYNKALLYCGERFLGSLTEAREPRRLLDHVWATGGVRACLERGQWNFAMRTVQLDYDTGVEPTFGYNRAFKKPDDWVLTSAVCSDEFFRVPLLQYVDEAGYWYATQDTIYVRYVSDDAAYGMNLGKWPESFLEYVGCYFGSKIILKLSNSQDELKRLQDTSKALLEEAKSASAMADPTSFPARGAWGLARNRFPNRRDGGGRTGPLIG